MNLYPFRYAAPYRRHWDALLSAKFEEVRRDAERRFSPTERAFEGLHGFGTVWAKGRLRLSGGILGGWSWRYGFDHEEYPASLGANYFSDDPLDLPPTEGLARRMAIAAAFVDAANHVFDRSDVQFGAHALEVVAADDETPVGLQARAEHHVLALDLMATTPNPKVIDQLVRDEFEMDRRGFKPGVDTVQYQVWQKVMRVNAARAMLRPDLPMLSVPGAAAFRRRLEALEDALPSG